MWCCWVWEKVSLRLFSIHNIIDKQIKKAQIIYVAVPADDNVSMKEKEKIDKDKDLCVELLSLWRVHCEVIPLVIVGLVA